VQNNYNAPAGIGVRSLFPPVRSSRETLAEAKDFNWPTDYRGHRHSSFQVRTIESWS